MRREFLGVIAAMCVAACSRESATRALQVAGRVEVSERGVGPVKIGMTLAEARSASQGTISAPPSADTASCGFANWRGGPAGVRFMTAAGRIVRVDVDRGEIPTTDRVRIGDSEARIAEAYPGRVVTTSAKYTKGHTLTIKPATLADSAYRTIFETDGRWVTRYRAGKLPQVAYVEGCG